jgi:hypothetical protein
MATQITLIFSCGQRGLAGGMRVVGRMDKMSADYADYADYADFFVGCADLRAGGFAVKSKKSNKYKK